MMKSIQKDKEKEHTTYRRSNGARKRIDVDRLYRAMRESSIFPSVRPWGGKSNNDVYKKHAWEHMNTYKLKAVLNGQPKNTWVEVGVTDNKKQGTKSDSGARLYVQRATKDVDLLQILCLIVSLLPESNFDSDGNLFLNLPGEEPVPWGGQCVGHDLLKDLPLRMSSNVCVYVFYVFSFLKVYYRHCEVFSLICIGISCIRATCLCP